MRLDRISFDHMQLGMLMCVVCCLATAPQCALAIIISEQGNFVSKVEDLEDLTFGKYSNLYVPPSVDQRNQFATLAATLFAGNLMLAETQASALSYDLIEFTDDVSGDVYFGLTEQLVGNVPTRGWGSYFVNSDAITNVLIEAPHPRFDTNTPEIAASIFRQAGSLGFLMAGAHRDANGDDSADVAHLANSIFQEVHEEWNGAQAENVAWSIHGFDDANHAFPLGTDVVLSNGDGGVSAEILAIDDAFEAANLLTFAYNTLALNDPLNVAVNGNVLGTTFSSLGGTTNVQGIHSRGIGGRFVHIEMEQSIRFDADNRLLAAEAIADAILETSLIPEPSSLALASICLAALGFARRREARRGRPG